jgi:CubicO group peptidase (beta-lactamase class C family)
MNMASLSPSLFNHSSFRTACIPAANGHFTARALAQFYSQLISNGTFDCKSLRNGDGAKNKRFGYGFQKFSLGGSDAAFGHGGIGGSFAMGDPASGVAVAITLNRLTEGCAPTKALLAVVCESLGLGELRGYGEDAASSGGQRTAA